MSEMPALDTLRTMAEDFDGKSEDEILDIIAERTKKMPVDQFNKLPIYTGAFKEVGELARTKPDEKKEGDFVMVLECTDIHLDEEEPSMSLASRMYMLVT